MRYFVGFVLFLLALGTLRIVGCGEDGPSCENDRDCDDGNECTDDRCSGGVCYFWPASGFRLCDDGDENECAHGECVDGVCAGLVWVDDGTSCESGGASGVCLCGVCRVGPFECTTDAECDDGNECTRDQCRYCNRSCESDTWYLECRSCDRDGSLGVCVEGVCEEKVECSGDEQCDDGVVCTDDVCHHCYGCLNLSNCSDDDPCTEDECDRHTDECYYPTSPDGSRCGCLRWGPDPDPICRIIGCPPVCTHSGRCQDGECI